MHNLKLAQEQGLPTTGGGKFSDIIRGLFSGGHVLGGALNEIQGRLRSNYVSK